MGLFACNNNPKTTENTSSSDSVTVPAPAPAEPQATQNNGNKQHIEKLHLTIDLPKGMKVENYGSFQLICNSDDIKNARCFTIEELNIVDIDYKNWEKKELGTGRTLYLQVETMDASNGGKDQRLTGVLILNNKQYLIKSEDHSDEGTPNARWCLPYIDSISSDELMG